MDIKNSKYMQAGAEGSFVTHQQNLLEPEIELINS